MIIYNISSSRRDFKGKDHENRFFLLLYFHRLFVFLYNFLCRFSLEQYRMNMSRKQNWRKTSTESLIKKLHVFDCHASRTETESLQASFRNKTIRIYAQEEERKKLRCLTYDGLSTKNCCLHARLHAQRSLKTITGWIIISLFSNHITSQRTF